jgi:hypothetical protein
MSPSSEPPFKVPLGLDVIGKKLLEGTLLPAFYDLNQDDFFAIVAMRYVEVFAVPDPGALKDPEKGFTAFCDLMTEYFLAAPSETPVSAKDEKGQDVNFFGEAILAHLGSQNLTSQSLYAYDGEKHSRARLLINLFVKFVAIKCFKRALSWLQEFDITKARNRIKELQEGKRKLRSVPISQQKVFK